MLNATLENCALKIRQASKIQENYDIPIDKIIMYFGGVISYVNFTPSNIKIRSRWSKDFYTIEINAALVKAQQKTMLAQSFAHYFLEKPTKQPAETIYYNEQNNLRQNNALLQIKIDAFSSMLLIPESLILSQERKTPRIADLAERFNTTRALTCHRLESLNLL